jgi:hypothetical protein
VAAYLIVKCMTDGKREGSLGEIGIGGKAGFVVL